MQAYRAMQVVKNGLYRSTGEVVDLLGAPDGSKRTLRVLMYHKVNDLWPNPITVPTAVFAEQMDLLGELGYVPVSLGAVRDYYVDGTPLPEGAVLITFDDGYRDNLENAFPVLNARGFPAVIFAPIGYLADGRPLPHEEPLVRAGVHNPTLDWDQLAELEAGGVRIEAHGIGHRPEHASLVQQAGYKLGFTAVSGVNTPDSDRFQLLRYNVEPYSARTFQLVLAGACDPLSVKDTVAGTYVRRTVTRALGIGSR